MLRGFCDWLIKKLGGVTAADWSRRESAQNLLLPLTSCTVASKRLSLQYFTKRTVSRYSGKSAELPSLTLSFNGVPLFNKDELEWRKFEWDLLKPARTADGIAQLLIFTDKNPGTLMGRLEPDEQAILILCLTWLRNYRQTGKSA